MADVSSSGAASESSCRSTASASEEKTVFVGRGIQLQASIRLLGLSDEQNLRFCRAERGQVRLPPQIVSNGPEHKLLIGAEDEGRSGILANVYEPQGHAHTFGRPG